MRTGPAFIPGGYMGRICESGEVEDNEVLEYIKELYFKGDK